MAGVLRLKKEFKNLRVIFVGGAESHVIADRLAAEKASVILSPPRCVPKNWETRRCDRDNGNRVKLN